MLLFLEVLVIIDQLLDSEAFFLNEILRLFNVLQDLPRFLEQKCVIYFCIDCRSKIFCPAGEGFLTFLGSLVLRMRILSQNSFRVVVHLVLKTLVLFR